LTYTFFWVGSVAICTEPKGATQSFLGGLELGDGIHCANDSSARAVRDQTQVGNITTLPVPVRVPMFRSADLSRDCPSVFLKVPLKTLT